MLMLESHEVFKEKKNRMFEEIYGGRKSPYNLNLGDYEPNTWFRFDFAEAERIVMSDLIKTHPTIDEDMKRVFIGNYPGSEEECFHRYTIDSTLCVSCGLGPQSKVIEGEYKVIK